MAKTKKAKKPRHRRPHRPQTRLGFIAAEIDWALNDLRGETERNGADFPLDWRTQIAVIDVVQGVLARYKGHVLRDHEVHATEPLPRVRPRQG